MPDKIRRRARPVPHGRLSNWAVVAITAGAGLTALVLRSLT